MIVVESKLKKNSVNFTSMKYDYIWVDTHRLRFGSKRANSKSYHLSSNISYYDDFEDQSISINHFINMNINVNTYINTGIYNITTTVLKEDKKHPLELNIDMYNWVYPEITENVVYCINKRHICDLPLPNPSDGKIALYTDLLALKYMNTKTYNLTVDIFYKQI